MAYKAGRNTRVSTVPPKVPPINVYASVPQKTGRVRGMNASMAASAVRTTGRERCTVASTTASNGANPSFSFGQIRHNEKEGLAPFDAVVEATVQRSRPVVLTALAAMLAFIPLTHSVFWGTLAYTLIGGTFGGTVLTLVFLPALYAIWFKITPAASE